MFTVKIFANTNTKESEIELTAGVLKRKKKKIKAHRKFNRMLFNQTKEKMHSFERFRRYFAFCLVVSV